MVKEAVWSRLLTWLWHSLLGLTDPPYLGSTLHPQGLARFLSKRTAVSQGSSYSCPMTMMDAEYLPFSSSPSISVLSWVKNQSKSCAWFLWIFFRLNCGTELSFNKVKMKCFITLEIWMEGIHLLSFASATQPFYMLTVMFCKHSELPMGAITLRFLLPSSLSKHMWVHAS